MINFYLVELVHALWMLDFYEGLVVLPAIKSAPMPPAQQGGLLSLVSATPNPYEAPASTKNISDLDKGHGKEIIETIGRIAEQLGLRTTKHRLFHFKLALKYDITEANYKNEIKVLRDALKHDLSECHFYHYPEAKVNVLLKFYPQWNDIITAFPVVKSEALAATDCYALQHNTACVFHIMRVAEHGLRALAKERRVQLPRNRPLDWGTWQDVIRELTKEATKIGEKASAGSP